MTPQALYRKFTPSWLKSTVWAFRQRADLITEFARDWSRFGNFSGYMNANKFAESLLSEIMIDYHRLEKGLSLANTRPGFGKDVSLRLISNVSFYLDKMPCNFTITDALETIESYLEYQNSCNTSIPEVVEAYKILILSYNLQDKCREPFATETTTRNQIHASSKFDYKNFITSRHSIRNFSDKPVTTEQLLDSIDLARYAPSVCNRQSWKVHIVTERKQIARIIQIQKGAITFAEKIPSLFIISSDLRRFVSAGERNQPWVDGGIFVMSQLLALHAQGLGACCLNWCGGRHADRALHKALSLNPSEVVIAVIAVGHMEEEFSVAKASKIPVSEIAIFH
jgi:nitroreductase